MKYLNNVINYCNLEILSLKRFSSRFMISHNVTLKNTNINNTALNRCLAGLGKSPRLCLLQDLLNAQLLLGDLRTVLCSVAVFGYQIVCTGLKKKM